MNGTSSLMIVSLAWQIDTAGLHTPQKRCELILPANKPRRSTGTHVEEFSIGGKKRYGYLQILVSTGEVTQQRNMKPAISVSGIVEADLES